MELACIDPAFEIYLAVLIVGVCAVIMWEMLKGCGRTATRAVRLRALVTPERLRVLLGRQQSTLTEAEFEELTSLARRGSRPERQRPSSRDRDSSVAAADRPQAVRVEVGVQTEPTFQLLEPGPAHVIIRNNNVVPVNPVFLAPGGRTVHIRWDCWGLRNSQVQEKPLCQRCIREFEEGTNLDT